MISLDQVNGQPLNGEQRSYLDGFFSGIANRGFKFSDVAPNPLAILTPQKADENLIFEERVKRELHPLDAFPLLIEHAAANKAPERENIFRFKWNGLFFLTPNREAFMARLRIPAGQLKTFQWREIARVAQELTTGYVQVTTRANIQIRLIEPKNAPEFLRRIQSVGLHARGSGADNIRNITASPAAGLDPSELIDVSPFCQQLAHIIINDRSFYDLPRKFNIAFHGGGADVVLEETNDIGVSAVKITEVQLGEGGSIKPGIYFRIGLGGATGHKAFASDLGVIVSPEEIVKVVAAMVRVYIANGNRTDRKKARLKHLLEKWPLEKFLEETEKVLGRKLIQCHWENGAALHLHPGPLPEGEGDTKAGLNGLQVSSLASSGKPLSLSQWERAGVRVNKTNNPQSHIGVFAQKQPGLSYVGVALPVGQVTPAQMLEVADLADRYGSGDLRLTVWQNFLIPNIKDSDIDAVKTGLEKIGLSWRQSSVRSGLVACTGNSYCKFAAANTKRHSLQLAEHLEQHVPLDQPVNIHLTGCPHSCAQHYIGDIGLLATTTKVNGASVEGYHVFVGGGFGGNQAIGRQVFSAVPNDQLNSTVKSILTAYLRNRQSNESFQQFTLRHDTEALQTLFRVVE